MPKNKPQPELPGGAPPSVPTRKILICIPCHSGKPDYATIVSCMNASDEARARGWETVLMLRSGDSILTRARDVLVSVFWESDCTDMLFVDSDISWDPGVFTKLMSHERDKRGDPIEFIGGVYRGRGDPAHYVCVPLDGGNLDVDYPAGIAKVRGVGTGFLRITRAGVKRMIDALPENHWYHDDFTAKGVHIWHLFDFTFDPTQDPGMRLRSEDYVLCDRFRKAGGKVWVDVELTLHHAGAHTWKGHFGDYLRSGADGHIVQVSPNDYGYQKHQQRPARDYAPEAVDAIAPGLGLIGAVENMIADGDAAAAEALAMHDETYA